MPTTKKNKDKNTNENDLNGYQIVNMLCIT
jgi:hypothetical protein